MLWWALARRGSAVAARLSEDPDVSVALVEAGPPDTAPEIHIPAAFPTCSRPAGTEITTPNRNLNWEAVASTCPGSDPGGAAGEIACTLDLAGWATALTMLVQGLQLVAKADPDPRRLAQGMDAVLLALVQGRE
jgi:GMC oxidoreductase